jgi:hypothetical protein
VSLRLKGVPLGAEAIRMVAKCLPLLFFEGWCVQGAAPVAACGV